MKRYLLLLLTVLGLSAFATSTVASAPIQAKPMNKGDTVAYYYYYDNDDDYPYYYYHRHHGYYNNGYYWHSYHRHWHYRY